MNVYPCKFVRIIDADTYDLELDLGFDLSLRERVRLYVGALDHFGSNAINESKQATQIVSEWVLEKESMDGKFYYHSMQYNSKQSTQSRCIGNITFLNKNTNEIHSLVQYLRDNGFVE